MVEERFVLLIIDSIMSLFRVDYSGRGELAERQQRLNKLLSNLLKIAQQFNVAIVLTNHVISEPSGALSFISNPIKPGFTVSLLVQEAPVTYTLSIFLVI